MPSMYEIYDHHSDLYDALVSREDFEANLRAALRDTFEWSGTRVVEAGIGSGRVTRWYADLATEVLGFDRSVHMLGQAARNLEPWHEKVRLVRADHLSLPVPDGSADIFIEGWAFGHLVLDRPDMLREVTENLVGEASRVTRNGAPIIIIETLGTNVDTPQPPHPVLGAFYSEIEKRYGFRRSVFQTDYLFSSEDEAYELCAFFFGEQTGASVKERLASTAPRTVVPEFTGMWVRE